MSDNVFDRYWSDSGSVFSNKTVLSPSFVPEQVWHRGAEIASIAGALRPAVVRGDKPENILVYGNSGLGKSLTVRYVFNELEERSEEVIPWYVNCWGLDSIHQLLLEVLPRFSRHVPARGVSTHELFSKLIKAMNRYGKVVVFGFDEFDRFLTSEERSSILYEFSRMDEKLEHPTGMVLIGSPVLREISDPRIKSSTRGTEVPYHPYSLKQLEDIFGERIEMAFKPDAVEEGLAEEVARFSYSRGSDVRVGLACLRIAGESASMADGKVKIHLLKEAGDKVVSGDVYSRISMINPHQREILYILALKGEMRSGELYSEYSKRVSDEKSDRSYRRYLEKLEKLELIDAKESGKGQKGQTRWISLRVSPREVKECYTKLLE